MFDLEQFFRDFFKLPEPKYKKEWVKVCNAMELHTSKGDPGKLLHTKRPNETEEVFVYRKHTFKHITYGSMNRATDELYRIVNGINFKVNAPDKTKEVLDASNFDGMPFNLYLQQTVIRRMIEDPNGLLVWLPAGEGVYDSAIKVEPTPYLVASSEIHYMDRNVLAFLSCENSPVIVNKKEVYEGLVFYILTKDAFYKLKQIGLKNKNTFQSELVYEHKMGKIPYCVLGGDKAKAGYFNSFFDPYIAFGDECLTQFSDFQAIMVNCGFPFIEEFLMECEVMLDPDKSSNPIPTGEEIFRGNKYTWRRGVRSPHGTIERKIPSNDKDLLMQENILDPSVPSIRFIHADVETAKNAWEVVKQMLMFAEDSLHLNLGRGLLSGDAKVEDRKAQTAMITKIGDNFFDNIYLSSLKFIDGYFNYREIDNKGISIDKPSTYDLKTEQDIATEITTLKTGNAPSFFIQQASVELSKKRFNGDKLSQKMFKIMVIDDPLFSYSMSERSGMVMSGTASKEAVIKSQNYFGILQRIAEEMSDDDFISADNKAIIEKANTILEDEYYPEDTTPILE